MRRFIGDFGSRVLDLRPVGEAPRPEEVGVDQQLRDRRHLGESAHHAASQGWFSSFVTSLFIHTAHVSEDKNSEVVGSIPTRCCFLSGDPLSKSGKVAFNQETS